MQSCIYVYVFICVLSAYFNSDFSLSLIPFFLVLYFESDEVKKKSIGLLNFMPYSFCGLACKEIGHVIACLSKWNPVLIIPH